MNGISPEDLPIDFLEAHKLARGCAQKAWLADLENAESGLLSSDHARGKWAGATHNRIAIFFDRLICAGYYIDHRPLGPRGRLRWVIVGYCADEGALLPQLHHADLLGPMRPGCDGTLMSARNWIAQATPDARTAASRLSVGWTLPLADLLAAATAVSA